MRFAALASCWFLAGCHVAVAVSSISEWYAGEVLEAVGYYYDIEAWAARTNNCRDSPSMACMACSMPVLESFERAGIAPIGVSNDWWFLPERSATCGMCMRVYMFDEPISGGTNPFRETVGQPWAYSARIYDDPVVGGY